MTDLERARELVRPHFERMWGPMSGWPAFTSEDIIETIADSLAATRREALEEAALACEKWAKDNDSRLVRSAAEVIRELAAEEKPQ